MDRPSRREHRLCVRCSVRLLEGSGHFALAAGGCLEEVCELCYLIGLLARLVVTTPLSEQDRVVLCGEVLAVVEALRAHCLQLLASGGDAAERQGESSSQGCAESGGEGSGQGCTESGSEGRGQGREEGSSGGQARC